MQKLFSAVPLFLMSGLAFAATKDLENAASAPPAEPVSMVYVVLFLALFVAMIVGFFAYMWWADRNKKQGG